MTDPARAILRLVNDSTCINNCVIIIRIRIITSNCLTTLGNFFWGLKVGWLGLWVGSHVDAVLHASDEPREHLQWLFCVDYTISTFAAIFLDCSAKLFGDKSDKNGLGRQHVLISPAIKLSSILKWMPIRSWNFAFHLIWQWSTHVPNITKIWDGLLRNFSNIDLTRNDPKAKGARII